MKKCANCGKETISVKNIVSLAIGFRYITCRECGKRIMLVPWMSGILGCLMLSFSVYVAYAYFIANDFSLMVMAVMTWLIVHIMLVYFSKLTNSSKPD